MGLRRRDVPRAAVIGIGNTWSKLVNCNANLRDLAVAVERGVLQAGGFPVEFPLLSMDVLQADEGSDFDSLRGSSPPVERARTHG